MINKVDVPQNLMGSFKRIARRIPVDLRKDEELIETIVGYLKLGGEKLARQAVDAERQTLELEIIQRKKKAREEALIRAAEARLALKEENSSENRDDDEDDDEDDAEDGGARTPAALPLGSWRRRRPPARLLIRTLRTRRTRWTQHALKDQTL